MEEARRFRFRLFNLICAAGGLGMIAQSLAARRCSAAWDVGLAMPAACGVLLLVFVAFRAARGRRLFAHPGLHAASIAVVTAAALFVLISEAFIISDPWLHDASRAPAARVTIVLGCGVHPDGRPSLALEMRLEKALAYWRQNPGTKLLMSGGKGDNEPVSEASAMKAWLLERDVPDADILVEDRSTSTWENFRYSAELLAGTGLEGEPIVFVTSDFHVFRSRMLAGRCGFKASALAAPTPAVIWINVHLREFVALYKSILLDH